MRLLIMGIFLSASFLSYGQQTFLGKRFALSLGSAINVPVSNKDLFFNSSVQNDYEWSMFPPKVEANIGVAVIKGLSLNVFGSFQGLQNTSFVANNYYSETDQVTATIDEFKFRSNSWGVGMEARLFQEFAPIGRYIFLGGQFNRTFTDVYPTYVSEVTDLILSTEITTIDKRAAGLIISNDLGVTFGFGRNRLISRLFSLDYGLRSTFFMRDRSSVSVESDNYKIHFRRIVDKMALANLQSSNYIEIYLRFGFSK